MDDNLPGRTIHRNNDTSTSATGLSDDLTITEATFEFLQLNIYYYPHRFFYLGIGTLEGSLTLIGLNASSVFEKVERKITENVLVFGFSFDWIYPKYGPSVDSLKFNRSQGTPLNNLTINLPFKNSQSILESIITFSFGWRFY